MMSAQVWDLRHHQPQAPSRGVAQGAWNPSREENNRGNHVLAAMPGLEHEPTWGTHGKRLETLEESSQNQMGTRTCKLGYLYCNESLHDSSKTVRPLRTESHRI